MVKTQPFVSTDFFERRAGFTLIELLLVVVLISVLLSFSLPRFKKAYENLQLQNFTREIYYLTRNLQTRAISERKVYCLTIDTTQGEFRASYQGQDEFRLSGDEYAKRYRIPPGITLLTEPQDKKEICFFPDASIDPVKLIFKDEDRKRAVSLVMSGESGDIQIQ